MNSTDWPSGKAAVDFYFIQDDGGMFKCTFQYEPYFCIACKVRYSLLLFHALILVAWDRNSCGRMASQEIRRSDFTYNP